MVLVYEVTIGDIVSTLSFLGAALGLMLNWRQSVRNNQTDRAIFLKDLYSPLFTDQELLTAWEKIEAPRINYQRDFFGTDIEKAADRLLAHCDMVAEIYRLGSISEREMQKFNYLFERLFMNSIIQQHLARIDAWVIERNISEGVPFSSFRTYCEARQFKHAPTFGN